MGDVLLDKQLSQILHALSHRVQVPSDLFELRSQAQIYPNKKEWNQDEKA
jgi:hypothetical protein